MKYRNVQTIILAIACIVITTTVQAQTSAFTYQGQLTDGGAPANGLFDLSFELFDDASVGSSYGALTNTPTAVSNGLFTVQLDFGYGVFDGTDLWLEIGAVTNGGPSFSTLSPRQPITSTPYALSAANATVAASADSVEAGDISGTINITQLPATIITNGASGVSVSGSFNGDGAGLVNVSATTLGGLSSSDFWHTSGNAGTTSGSHFLGTTDNQPLEFRVNNKLVLRIEDPTLGFSPNFVGGQLYGASPNNVDSGTVGAVIDGGSEHTIEPGANYSIIGGGKGNGIESNSAFATIAGGNNNDIRASATYSAIGGGNNNKIDINSSYSTISGGNGNLILSDSDYSSIGGGFVNYLYSSYATIAGGIFNNIGDNSNDSSIGGGRQNRIENNAIYATIPGGRYNVATNFAFAAGYRAEAKHTGAFVWADSTETNFTSTATNQFNVRASGGARFETSGGGMTVDQKSVTVGEEQLRIVRGKVALNGIHEGAGFTVVVHSTTSTIQFPQPFSAKPTITATVMDVTQAFHTTISEVTTSGFKIATWNKFDNGQKVDFNFIAIGPR